MYGMESRGAAESGYEVAAKIEEGLGRSGHMIPMV